MELVAIRKAAVLFFMRLELMNPQHKAVNVRLIAKMTEHYGFLKSPQTFKEATDYNEGVSFQAGSWQDTEIDEIRLFHNGILIATGESTDRCEAVFDDLMGWMSSEIGLWFEQKMVEHRAYISQIVVRSDADLDRINPAVAAVASEFFESRTGFGSVGFFVKGKVDEVPVRIERLAVAATIAIPWNEYWAQAPLPTSRHLEFMQAFEKALAG